MKYETIVKPKEKRIVETCKMDEAFRLDKSWYVRVEIYDENIQNYDEFFQEHVLYGSPNGETYADYVPALHLGSQTFCYVYGKQKADEWADLQPSLLVK